MSAFTAIIDRLGELTESELRQLNLIVQVRLGQSPSNTTAQVKPGGRPGKAAKKGGKTAPSKSAGKGNPSRKSQWATNPLYVEYARLKKAVETQSKEQKCSFNAVDTTESRAYKEAFIHWMEAKSSFRGRKTSTEKGSDSESESDRETTGGPFGIGPSGSKPSPPAPAKAGAKETSSA